MIPRKERGRGRAERELQRRVEEQHPRAPKAMARPRRVDRKVRSAGFWIGGAARRRGGTSWRTGGVVGPGRLGREGRPDEHGRRSLSPPVALSREMDWWTGLLRLTNRRSSHKILWSGPNPSEGQRLAGPTAGGGRGFIISYYKRARVFLEALPL